VIFVDSSVWIAHLRGLRTTATVALEKAAGREPLLLGDLVLLEVLQGARDELHAKKLETALRRFRIVPLLAKDLAVKAARNYRTLRSAGVTVRKTVDIVIGTYCIEHGHALLHDDRDFAPMAAYLGLKEFPA